MEAALPAQRRPDGRPSFADYKSIGHPQIVNVFAERFDQLPQFIVGPCRPDSVPMTWRS